MKNYLFKSLVLLSALTLAACSSDSDDSILMEGSLEKDGSKVMIVSDYGVEYIIQDGSYPTFTSRKKIVAQFDYFSDVRENGIGSEVPVKNVHIRSEYDTQTTTSRDTSSFTASDPFIAIVVNNGQRCYNDYLNIQYQTWFYTKNRPSGADYSEYSVKMEVFPSVLEAENGRDTILVNFVLDANRAEDEDPQGAHSPDLVCFDISNFTTTYGFPATEADGSDKTYIIRVRYIGYPNTSSYDDSAAYEKFATTEWTPNKPFYGQQ